MAYASKLKAQTPADMNNVLYEMPELLLFECFEPSVDAKPLAITCFLL